MIALTHAYYLSEDAKEQPIMRPYAPLGILYISAYLQQQNIKHLVFDSTFSSFQEQIAFISDNNIKLLGLYVNLMTKLNALRLMAAIKSNKQLKDCKVVLGGPDLRHNAKEYLLAGADMLVLGEGEQTFFEIAQGFATEQRLLSDISGTAYLNTADELVVTEERTLLKNLNELPMPARHTIDISRYLQVWKKHHGYSMLSVSTMRGCPYTCKWCSRAVYGGTYRRRSAAIVVQELELLKHVYGVDRIWFVDDVFTISHKWLREFCDELKKKQLTVSYEIITRADRMNAEVIALLKESGCFRVWIGAESGSQKIIDAMDRRVEVQQVQQMIQKTIAAGIEAGTFIMLGYPGEVKQDIKATIQHLINAKPSTYTITVAYPIAGTPLYNQVQDSLQSAEPWHKRTDRDLDFKREHSKQYYIWAVKWVNNAVRAHAQSNPLKKIKHSVLSKIAQLVMLIV